MTGVLAVMETIVFSSKPEPNHSKELPMHLKKEDKGSFNISKV